MTTIALRPVGTVRQDGADSRVVLEPGRGAALDGLDGFSHAVVLWWADRADEPGLRTPSTVDSPYTGGPDTLGVFATRSPARPNPVCLSVARVLSADPRSGELELDWLDAEDGTPVLDVKPYSPSADRPARPTVPGWAAAWPRTIEESAAFDWDAVFGG